MKRLKIYIALCLAVLGMTGCEENDRQFFDTSYAALNIWFGTESSSYESTTHNYSYTLGRDSVMFYARVAGMPVDYDRTFTLEACDGDLDKAAGSYETTTYTIKAGEVIAEFPIYFDTSKLNGSDTFGSDDEQGSITFRLVESDTFHKGAEGYQTLKVVLRNYLAKPDEWDSQKSLYAMAWNRYFGTYSKVKYQFMIQHTGLIDFHISYYATTNYDEETNTISANYATYLRDKLRIYLDEYNNDPANTDTPLRDETGNLVTF